MVKVIKQYFVESIKKILGIKSPSKLEDLASPTYPSTLEGRILLFDTVNKNGAVFSKDCKIDISKKGGISMASHDNYDKDILKALQRIATSLDKIEKKMSDKPQTPNDLRESMGLPRIENDGSKFSW